MTGLYQSSFFERAYVLNRAWQEIPGSVLVGLIDTIRTRVLRFALQLKDDLGMVGENLNELPKDQIDQTVTNYIFGGVNVIASRNFTINKLDIQQGDWTALTEALHTLGVQTSEIAELKSDLEHDSKEVGTPGLGKRTADWLKKLGKKSGEMALSVGVEVAKEEATNWIVQYLGHGH